MLMMNCNCRHSHWSSAEVVPLWQQIPARIPGTCDAAWTCRLGRVRGCRRGDAAVLGPRSRHGVGKWWDIRYCIS